MDSLFNEVVKAELKNLALEKDERNGKSIEIKSGDRDILNRASPDIDLELQDEIEEAVNEKLHRFFVSDEIPIKVKFYYSRTISSLCCLLAVFNTLISNVGYTFLGFLS